MGFFAGAHNFIIDGPSDAQGEGNHQDIVNQALEKARVAVDNAAKFQRSTGAGVPGASGLAISMPTSSSCNTGGHATDVSRILGEGNQSLMFNAEDAAFGAAITSMSAEEKTKMKAELAEMRKKLDARKARKEQKIANGEGRFGRKSGTPDQGYLVGGSRNGGFAAIAASSEVVNGTGNQGQSSLLPPQPMFPGQAPPGSHPPLPPQLQGPPPSFDPSNPEFQQFLRMKNFGPMAPMGVPGPLPPFSMMPNGPPGSFPSMNMNFLPPPNFYPPQGPLPNTGGISTYPPQPALATQQHNDEIPNTDPEYAITVEPDEEEPGETSKEDAEELREDELRVPVHIEAPTSSMNTIASPTPQVAVGSATTSINAESNLVYPSYGSTSPATLSPPQKEKKKRRRSSPIPLVIRNLFSSSEKARV
ncbi:hypothetical protein D9756_006333 [Leucocoprinus leucothites]|uniref:Uncharacterized protein n=1 Tax=Leucocoprinus leucothites TaxID=201217 RepID=A0A8H5D4K6_9AGAR|nr:hypothetical protein D9756_006333 [Leucoagaricus leucothites]